MIFAFAIASRLVSGVSVHVLQSRTRQLALSAFSLPTVLPYRTCPLTWAAYVKVIYHCWAAAGILCVVSTHIRWQYRPAL